MPLNINLRLRPKAFQFRNLRVHAAVPAGRSLLNCLPGWESFAREAQELLDRTTDPTHFPASLLVRDDVGRVVGRISCEKNSYPCQWVFSPI